MATAKLEQVQEHFLTCVVCSGSYKDPCTLACQHSFCRKCITDYLKTKPASVRNRLIPCPSCRQDTVVPNPAQPPDKWAWQIKPGIMLLGLIDTLEMETVQTGN